MVEAAEIQRSFTATNEYSGLPRETLGKSAVIQRLFTMPIFYLCYHIVLNAVKEMLGDRWKIMSENIFDILTDKYDVWYDSEEGSRSYESEHKYTRTLAENCPGRFSGVESAPKAVSAQQDSSAWRQENMSNSECKRFSCHISMLTSSVSSNFDSIRVLSSSSGIRRSIVSLMSF